MSRTSRPPNRASRAIIRSQIVLPDPSEPGPTPVLVVGGVAAVAPRRDANGVGVAAAVGVGVAAAVGVGVAAAVGVGVAAAVGVGVAAAVGVGVAAAVGVGVAAAVG